jgi:hypothetical protein
MVNKEERSQGRTQAKLAELEKALYVENETLIDPAFSLLATSGNPGRVVIIISDDQLGVDDEAHGQQLRLIFLKGLCDRFTQPDEIVFYHRGVLLLEEGHPAQDILLRLSAHDVEIKASLESLTFYNKEPAVLKIQPVPMSEITRDLLKADRVIHP